MIAALLIFLFTLTFVIWQPKGLGIGWSASAGALLALLTGVIKLSDIPVVWDIIWNATTTFIAIVVISLLLDEAGFFRWAALNIARWAKGNTVKLYFLVILLGALVSALFANDGAALILTPIVVAMLEKLAFDRRTTLAFVMGAGFVADTASLPLITSNLTNIVTADYFGLGYGDYASVMVPVNLVGLVATLVMLWLVYHRAWPRTYDWEKLPEPASAIRDPVVFKAGFWALGAELIAFFVLEPLGIPISAIAACVALALLVVAQRSARINTREVLKVAPWHIVVFSLGMYLVVYGLRNAGLTDGIAELLSTWANEGLWVATLGTGFLTAFMSSIMNNLPSVLVGALSIDASTASETVREGMIYANIVGCDLGPKITPIGSLATLLWLFVLSKKRLHITWGEYFRTGVILTLPVLLVTLTALVWRLG